MGAFSPVEPQIGTFSPTSIADSSRMGNVTTKYLGEIKEANNDEISNNSN